MTGMEGNKHFEYALAAVGDRRNDPAAAAILALAFEQRTANLLALLQLAAVGEVAQDLTPLVDQIKERLGLK